MGARITVYSDDAMCWRHLVGPWAMGLLLAICMGIGPAGDAHAGGGGTIAEDAHTQMPLLIAPAKGKGSMAYVEGGCFKMGCGSWMETCEADERPAHEVCLDAFYIDRFEVHQDEYTKHMPNPSFNHGGDYPVDNVTWTEARDYCEKLGKRLPTEAEWEYAARSGGREQIWSGTSNIAELINYAWYSRYSGFGGQGTHPVGARLSNALGLYDMTGNVWEWVSDRYASDYYGKSTDKNPRGAAEGELRVVRGGSWYYRQSAIRTTARFAALPGTRQDDFGFRCALGVEQALRLEDKGRGLIAPSDSPDTQEGLRNAPSVP